MEIKNLTGHELVKQAGETIIGTGSGLKAQHAQAELTRRLIESIDNLNKETSRYSMALINLTIILFVIALIQLMVSIYTSSTSWMTTSFLLILLGLILYLVLNYLFKSKTN